jgi:glycerol-3-phosphate responsive antiterminator
VTAGPATGLPALLLSAHDRAPGVPAGAGLLLHDLGLLDLVRLSARPALPLAVDLDTVEGLAADDAAVEFVVVRLGIGIVITKRPALASRAVALGCLALLHVHCLDSTGLERALAAHPGSPVGTAVSPGLVLAHLPESQRLALPAPVLAYGLVRRQEERRAARAAGAAAVVMTRDENPP